MAEITKARTGLLVRKIFEFLMTAPDGLPVKELFKKLEKEVPPTEFENSDYPNRPGVRRYEIIVRFSTIAAVKAGWLIKSRGIWAISESGKLAFKNFSDPVSFRNEADKLYRQWANNQLDNPEEINSLDSVSTSASTTFEEADERAWAEIFDYLKTMNPYDFQNLIKALLEAMGYFINWVAPPGQDGGVDIIAGLDPLGTKNPRIKVQVKRRAENKVDVAEIREFFSLLSEQDVGLYISLGGFTSSAEKEARQKETRKLTLVDAEKLLDLWQQHYIKVSGADRRLLPIRPIYYLEPRLE